MRELMDVLEARAQEIGLKGLYVENILNEFLPGWFSKRGYCVIEGFPPNAYRLFEESQT